MRNRFRFSIRELALLIVIVALAVALIIEHRQLPIAREQAEAGRRQAAAVTEFLKASLSTVQPPLPSPTMDGETVPHDHTESPSR